MADETVTVPTSVSQNSRYFLTKQVIDDSVRPGVVRMGRWRAPDLKLTNATQMIAQAEMRLDLVAYDVHREVNLWWTVAWASYIKNVLTDLAPGQVVQVPSRLDIRKALAGD